jgi:hypothetical protein
MKKGSIEMARKLCFEIDGDEGDDPTGFGYECEDIAEILSAEVVRLRECLAKTRQYEPLTDEDVIGELKISGWTPDDFENVGNDVIGEIWRVTEGLVLKKIKGE